MAAHRVDLVLQASRQYNRQRQGRDLLADRERSARYWRRANETNPGYGLLHSRVFYFNPSFRDRLLPGVRAHLEAKARAERAQWLDDMRRSAEAARVRAAGPLPLFEGQPA